MTGFCARNGCDIQSEMPISAGLMHNISEYVLPLMSKKYRCDFCIRAQTKPEPRRSSIPDGVGAVLDSDIDHLHSVWRYKDDHTFGLTHLVRYSSGSEIDCQPSGYPANPSVFGGLTVIDVVTNLGSIAGTDTDLFRDLSGAFLLGGLWSVFFVSMHPERSMFEDYSLREKLLSYLSGRSIRLLPEGVGRSRLQKFGDMKSSALTTGCLYPCSEGKGRNCGVCRSCLETLWAADAFGALDGFSGTFDVESYKEERTSRLLSLLESDENDLLEDIKGSMSRTDDEGYREAFSAASKIDGAIDRVGIPVSERKSVLERYVGESERAALHYARYMATSSDPNERSEGLEILEESGTQKGRLMLAEILKKSGSAAEKKRAFTICSDMAAEGNPEAMLVLGNMYLEGTAVPKNVTEAKSWLRKAASEGNAEAGVQLASNVLKDGTDEERAEAFRICSLLSDAGDARAMELLGQMYIEGKGTARDIPEAKRCFRLAAGKGNDASRVTLIKSLMENGDKADRKEAFIECSSYFNETQDPYAEYLLAVMYLRGIGVDPDVDVSIDYMNRSLENGDRIHYFTDYIFEMRREIQRLRYPRPYVNRYYKILESHGSWIGIYSRFKGKPFFPHGLMNIFISDRAVIGMSCTIYQNVTIGSNKMPGHEFKGAPVISDHVFIGAGANIIGAVTIGEGAVIAAGANVARDVPPGATVVCKSEILKPKGE